MKYFIIVLFSASFLSLSTTALLAYFTSWSAYHVGYISSSVFWLTILIPLIKGMKQN